MPQQHEAEQQQDELSSASSPQSSSSASSSTKKQTKKTSKRRPLKKSSAASSSSASSTTESTPQDDTDHTNNELTSTNASSETTNTASLNNNRQWVKDESFQNQQTAAYSILVGITTRDESEPVYDTPCKMYSSLRYKLQYKCTVNMDACHDLKESPKLLMCRVTVIDEDTAKEIKKDGKAIIDDSLISLKQTSSGGALSFEATHKIKFKDVSFHYNKSKWRLLLQLYSDAHGSISTPVVVLKSAGFLVYARRPKVSERGASDGLLTSGMNAPTSSNASTSSGTAAANGSTDVTSHHDESSVTGAHVVASALLNQASGDKKKKKKGAAHMDLKKRKRSTSMAGNTTVPLKIEKKQEPSKLLTASNGEDTLNAQQHGSDQVSATTTENAPVASSSPKTLKQKKKLMDKFSNTLDTLLKLHDEMDPNDKTIAFELLQQKLYSHFYSNLVEQQQHWIQMTQMPSPENGDMDHSSHHAHHDENGGIHIDDHHQIEDSNATILQAGSADDIEHDSFSCAHQNQHHAFPTHGDTQQHNSCHDSGLFLSLCEIGSHHSHNHQMSTSLSFETESILASSDFHPLFN
ncbi:hypothetical protein C9374_003915 [Naegleria lovaniensis]|uniref:Uncharacterized protein n=1 Tax=Naegleria lovaniensis TaxID=51637 RepID=A0AA88H8N6_NAELO|nr:uncharacterized protein C9374_003915 [Naegleria lovaniensis]KAG2394151.1 hypothetical protein C9374_003915 [Naegleria lovaniensis]